MKEDNKCNEREGSESHYPWTQKAETSTRKQRKEQEKVKKGKKGLRKYYEMVGIEGESRGNSRKG